MDGITKLEPIIKISGLTKEYGEKRAVDNLYLTVGKGEVFGLLGPNGAGKTTTVLMLLGLTEPTDGFAWIDGHDCIRDSIAIKQIVGYLPDNVGFYNDLTGRENLRFTGRLNGLKGDLLEQRIKELLARVGMTDAADKKAGTYSRGMKQRLGIADVLMKDPKVIIMDEPTLGIDPQGMRELLELIRELVEKDHRTIMISSHQLQQIQQVCDRVGIFVEGKLIACGPIKTLAQQLEKEGHFVTEIQADPMDARLIQLLEAIESVKMVSREGQSLIIDSTEDIRKEMGRKLAEQGYALLGLKQKGGELDEIYRQYFEQEN